MGLHVLQFITMQKGYYVINQKLVQFLDVNNPRARFFYDIFKPVRYSARFCTEVELSGK